MELGQCALQPREHLMYRCADGECLTIAGNTRHYEGRFAIMLELLDDVKGTGVMLCVILDLWILGEDVEFTL